MAFDGIITGAMAIYLDSILEGGKIEKVYQPDRDELIFHVYKEKAHFKLFISANSSHPRMHLLDSGYSEENPKIPPAFSMLLRKHFRGGRIEKIHQFQSERIIEIHVIQKDELGYPKSKKLIVEIMGKHSNIVAVDSDTGKILDSIKRISPQINRYRSILPGVEYIYPPDHGKISFYDLSTTHFETEPTAILSKIQGISPAMAKEISIRCRKAKTSVNKVLQDFANSIRRGDYRALVYEEASGFPVDFHIFELSEMASVYGSREFDDLNSCLLYYYSHKDLGNRMRQKLGDLNRHITASLNRLYLKREKLERDLIAAENSEVYRIYGELLTSALHDIKKGSETARVFNYYENDDIDIPLDPRFSPALNAKNYFKKYNKSKIAQKEKRIQIRETEESIDYLESALVFTQNSRVVSELNAIREELIEEGFIKRKQKKLPDSEKRKPLLFSPEKGVLIRVGRNNRENEFLTFKQAGKKDLWFHAKNIPGSHVVLSVENETNIENTNPIYLEKAAALAAYFSKAQNSDSVEVDYTAVSNVKKIPGARPGMVTYKNQKTLLVQPQNDI